MVSCNMPELQILKDGHSDNNRNNGQLAECPNLVGFYHGEGKHGPVS